MSSFFALCNQVGYTQPLKSTLHPFPELLQTKAGEGKKFIGTPKTKIFKNAEKGINKFDMGRITCLAMDWSKEGFGYTLSQKHCDHGPGKGGKLTTNCCREGWRLVLAGSRFCG